MFLFLQPERRIMKPILVTILFVILSACGERTSIQTGEVGKVLGTSGLERGIQHPGVFRMPSCMSGEACPKLVRLQVNKSVLDLEINSLFLPLSNVDIRNVKVGIQFQVKADEQSINRIFEEVRPEVAKDTQGNESTRVLLITDDMVAQVFLARKASDAIVTALRGYRVEQVLSEVPEISKATMDQINIMLQDTPIEVTELGFSNGIGEVPEEVISAKRKLFAIEEDRARRIKSLESDLIVEEHRQAVQKVRVLNDVINARGAGTDYSTYVFLKTQERFADAAESGTPVALGQSLMSIAKPEVK